MKKELTIYNEVDQLTALAGQLEAIGEEWDLSPALVTNINLVLEEAVSNIIFYAYDDKQTHEITITIEKAQQMLTVTIHDDGKPFDPTKSESPDIDLSAEEREIGGLGIFLMGKIMDSINYERKNNKNILTLKKSLE